jgi:hypothetical protein
MKNITYLIFIKPSSYERIHSLNYFKQLPSFSWLVWVIMLKPHAIIIIIIFLAGSERSKLSRGGGGGGREVKTHYHKQAHWKNVGKQHKENTTCGGQRDREETTNLTGSRCCTKLAKKILTQRMFCWKIKYHELRQLSGATQHIGKQSVNGGHSTCGSLRSLTQKKPHVVGAVNGPRVVGTWEWRVRCNMVRKACLCGSRIRRKPVLRIRVRIRIHGDP